MSRNKGFSRLTKFLQPPKLVDGIFEVSFRLQKFWWVQKIVRTRNGFALTDFVAKQTKFRVVRTGPMSEKYKRSELQRNKSVEYGPATEKEPRFSQAPSKVYARSV